MTDRPRTNVAALDAIVGNWRTEGRVVGDDLPIRGTDRYEWLAGGHFLIHHVDVVVGDRKVVAIEIIGEHDEDRDAFIARSYDNEGEVGLLLARIEGAGVVTFTGGSDIAQAARPQDAALTDQVRSTLRVADDGQSMTALWERTPDGLTWTPWMDVRFTREG